MDFLELHAALIRNRIPIPKSAVAQPCQDRLDTLKNHSCLVAHFVVALKQVKIFATISCAQFS